MPEKSKGRTFYQHNPNITLMRTTPEENGELGRTLAEKLNLSTAPVTVLIPLKGLSVIDAPGGPFRWPEANQAIFDAIRADLREDIPVIEMHANINDAEFARACSETLLVGMKARER